MQDLSNKVVLVTGASGGIGQAIVQRFQASGAVVVGTDRMDGVADHWLSGDLTDAAFCDGLPKRVVDLCGRIDILVNNAGIIRRGVITDATDEDYAMTMAINVEAPYRLCRAAIPLMGQGSAIVNTTSCWGLRPGPGHPAYVMSKAAIASLTQCLARDHAHQGIRVNAVAPNEVNTPMIRTGFEIRGLDAQKGIEELNASVPLGHIAEPEDIADVVLFLASDQARYVTGAVIEAHGGKAVH